MARYAVINNDTKKVVNVIEWDGHAKWSPPKNHIVFESDTANIGCLWDENSQSIKQDFSKKTLQGSP